MGGVKCVGRIASAWYIIAAASALLVIFVICCKSRDGRTIKEAAWLAETLAGAHEIKRLLETPGYSDKVELEIDPRGKEEIK